MTEQTRERASVKVVECVQLEGLNPNAPAPDMHRVAIIDDDGTERCFDFDDRRVADCLARTINSLTAASRASSPALGAPSEEDGARAMYHAVPRNRPWSTAPQKLKDHYLLMFRAVIALARTTDASGWRDIATAPKDGTPILIWEPTGHYGAIRNRYSENRDVPFLSYDDFRWSIGYWRPDGGWGNRNCADVNPTHWQPLPSPPASPTKPGDET